LSQISPNVSLGKGADKYHGHLHDAVMTTAVTMLHGTIFAMIAFIAFPSMIKAQEGQTFCKEAGLCPGVILEHNLLSTTEVACQV